MNESDNANRPARETGGRQAAGTPPSTTAVPTDESCMRRCLEIARRALVAGDVPVGAIVVREGRIVGEGIEVTRAALDPAGHAEVEALRAACRALGTLDLTGATLYTTVEPCVLCAFAIRQTRIARVVFGVTAGALGSVSGPYPLLLDPAHRPAQPPVVLGGILAEQCQRLLDERTARRRPRDENP